MHRHSAVDASRISTTKHLSFDIQHPHTASVAYIEPSRTRKEASMSLEKDICSAVPHF